MIDANIVASGLRPFKVEEPGNQLMRLMQLQGMQDESRARQLLVDREARALDDQNRLRQLLATSDPADLPRQLYRGGFLEQAIKLEKERREGAKFDREAELKQLEAAGKRVELTGRVAATMVDEPSYQRGLAYLQANGVDTRQFPAQFDPAGAKQLAQASMDYKQQIDAALAERQFAHTQTTDATRLAETARHNRTTEYLTQRGQDQPVFVPVENVGLYVGDRRSGTARPVTDPAGAPVKPVKQPPASVVEGLQTNARGLTVIDDALALLAAPEAKGALGLKNLAPGAIGRDIVNRLDPKGVEVRAAVADVGSLEIKNRSGATVTVGEEPRLVPFIPLPTDESDVAVKKLKRLRELIKNDYEFMGEFYPDAKAKADAAISKRPPPKSAAPKVPAAGAPRVIDFKDLP